MSDELAGIEGDGMLIWEGAGRLEHELRGYAELLDSPAPRGETESGGGRADTRPGRLSVVGRE